MNKSDISSYIKKAKQKKVTEIDFSNRGITELPEEIGDLIHLQKLNLSYNNITSLPSTICNLVNLKELYLTRNNITKLPSGIGNLQQLNVLDISYNSLVKIPREIGLFINLESLDASYCELHSLPYELTNLYNLKHLNLEENPLEHPPQKVVKRGLYAIMHYLTIEKRKNEASRVMLQIFNMPEIIQVPFKQYIKYFNQMVSIANHKDVVFDLNFINQDFYQEVNLNAGVEGYLYDIMRYIKEKLQVIKNSSQLDNEELSSIIFESRIDDIKEKLKHLNSSLDDKIDEIKKIKNELNGLYSALDSEK